MKNIQPFNTFNSKKSNNIEGIDYLQLIIDEFDSIEQVLGREAAIKKIVDSAFDVYKLKEC